jgi:hypothetical protein
MEENVQNINPQAIMIIWLTMLMSPLLIITVLYFAIKFDAFQPVIIDNTHLLFWFAMASSVIPAYFISRVKHANYNYLNAVKTLSGNEIFELKKFYRQLLIGINLANLPAILGISYFVVSGDFNKTSLLIAISIILSMMMKPELVSC